MTQFKLTILLSLLFAPFNTAFGGTCSAEILSVLSKKSGSFQHCFEVDSKHFLVLHRDKKSPYLSLSSYSQKNFGPQSQPLQTKKDLAEKLVDLPGKAVSRISTQQGLLVADFNSDGRKEFVLSFQIEPRMIYIAIAQIDANGQINSLPIAQSSQTYFSPSHRSSPANSLQVLKVDPASLLSLLPQRGQIRIQHQKNDRFLWQLTWNDKKELKLADLTSKPL